MEEDGEATQEDDDPDDEAEQDQGAEDQEAYEARVRANEIHEIAKEGQFALLPVFEGLGEVGA